MRQLPGYSGADEDKEGKGHTTVEAALKDIDDHRHLQARGAVRELLHVVDVYLYRRGTSSPRRNPPSTMESLVPGTCTGSMTTMASRPNIIRGWTVEYQQVDPRGDTFKIRIMGLPVL
jgi:hypothetical protein